LDLSAVFELYKLSFVFVGHNDSSLILYLPDYFDPKKYKTVKKYKCSCICLDDLLSTVENVSIGLMTSTLMRVYFAYIITDICANIILDKICLNLSFCDV